MPKFNIGDKVVISDPAYLVTETDAHGFVSSAFFGKTATVRAVKDEDANSLIGTAYDVMADGLGQTISQRYLTAAPEPDEPTIPDGVYVTNYPDAGDTVIVKDGKAIEVLETSDGCDPKGHSGFLNDTFYLTGAVRLVAPEIVEPEPLPDGIYADSYGDLVHIKDGKARNLVDDGGRGYLYSYDTYGTGEGPFTPAIKEDTAK